MFACVEFSCRFVYQSSNLPLDYVSQFSKMYGIVENFSSFDSHSERE